MTAAASAAAGRLREWPRRRVKIAELERMLLDAEPDLQFSPERRSRLAALASELAQAGTASLPAAGSWDRSARPALPRFLTLPARPGGPGLADGSQVAWRAELAWAASERFTQSHFEALQAVNAFLRDGGAGRPKVPARERSVQLFGDEKRLDRLQGSMLFAPGRLTLDLLACEQVRTPFVWQRTGPGPDVLVLENSHTYHSFARALADAGSAAGAAVYGAGRHFESSVHFLADLPFPARRVLYFGDLDAAGLQIPASASRSAQAAGLPAVQPAAGLYELLLACGRPAPSSGPAGPAPAAWLPEHLREPAARLLQAGQRIAQEWAGTEALRANPELLAGL